MVRGLDGGRGQPGRSEDQPDTTEQGWSRRRVLTQALAASGATLVATTSATAGQTGTYSSAQATDAWSEQTRLTASDVESISTFGSSLAVADDGDTAVIGAYLDFGPDGETGGTAYVFQRNSGNWNEQAKLTASDGDSKDVFGYSVALTGDGDTVVIGAPGDKGPRGYQAGSAYVFQRNSGNWNEQAKLTASDAEYNTEFGASVGVGDDGATAVIGAKKHRSPSAEGGAAYVFEHNSGNWNEQAKLTASDGDRYDVFGSSVDVASDRATAVVGAPGDADPNGDEAGSAYVFERNSGNWDEQAKLTANDGDSEDVFGSSVSVASDGSTAVVGAPEDEDPNNSDSGSAYVFEHNSGNWNEQAKLAASDGQSFDRFGSSVGVGGDGSTAVVGAPEDNDRNNKEVGSAYVFERNGGNWNEQAKLTANDGDSEDYLGSSVGMAGDEATAIVGASGDEGPDGDSSGSAYVFEETTGTETPGGGDTTGTETPDGGDTTGTETPDGGEGDAKNDGDSTGMSTPVFGAISTIAGVSVLAAIRVVWNRRRAGDDSE